MRTNTEGDVRPGRVGIRAGIAAGIAAGISSTLAQAVVWLASGRFPETLFRDARLAAAIVMGRSVLPPPSTFDAPAMIIASLVHFALSVAYGLLLGAAIRERRVSAAAAGTVFGLALYAVNLHGFTLLFPWFAQARTWDTLLAHLVFGWTAAWVYRRLSR